MANDLLGGMVYNRERDRLGEDPSDDDLANRPASWNGAVSVCICHLPTAERRGISR